MDFEEANPVSDPNGSGGVTTASALPGWTVTVDGVQQSLVGYNTLFAEGGATVTLVGPNNILPPIDGGYSVGLEGSFGTSGISQTGLIPVGTESLLVEAVVLNAQFDVTLGGQTLQPVPLYTAS